MAMQLPYSKWLRCRDNRTAELRHCMGHARCSCTAQLYSVAGRLHGVDLAYCAGREVPDSVARKCAGFGASEGSCNPVKVTRPQLPIGGGILRTQAGQLDLHICAVTRRGERDLN